MFSNEQLQALIEGEIIGNTFPYDMSNEQEIEAHIRRLFHRINRIPHVVCEAEWDHFGSGYASFVELFCYEKKDSLVIEEKGGRREIKTEGIIIDVCRLAPVAIMGKDERSITIQIDTSEEVGGAYSSLIEGPHRLCTGDKLQPLSSDIKMALREFDYELLKAEELSQPLPFRTKIPTIYRKSRQYLVMDAIFYWED